MPTVTTYPGVFGPYTPITFTRASTATYFDSTGTLQSAAIDVPRLDYNPSTLAAQGFLVEEARTNSIRNNTMQGAVAGTPGTQPTNWIIQSPNAGLTREIVGVGTQNGITYIDVRFSGTTNATSANIIFPESNTSVAALNGQSWAASSWIALVGGSFTNITSSNLILRFNDGAGAVLTSNAASFLGATATQVRYVAAGTASNASTAFVATCIQLGFSNGVAIDITLRIGMPQLELGAFATSVIPTTTTALTRSQDRAVVSTLSPWFNATTGTIYAEFAVTQPVAGGNQFLARFSDSGYNNSIADNVDATGFAALVTASGGVFDGSAATAGILTANTVNKFAGAYALNNLAASRNGGTVATDATATIPSGMTRFDLGSDHLGFNNIKAGYLRRLTYYPRALSAAELQAITTP